MRYLTAILVFLLFSCSEENEVRDPDPTPPSGPELERPVHNALSITRHFSSQETMDRFSLVLDGPSADESQLLFVITSAKGDTLFLRKGKGIDLIWDLSEEERGNDEMQEKMIKERMSYFFASSNFSNPPYTFNDPARSGFNGDLILWKEITEDSTAWSFEFSLHPKGRIELVAYSLALDSILVYDHQP